MSKQGSSRKLTSLETSGRIRGRKTSMRCSLLLLAMGAIAFAAGMGTGFGFREAGMYLSDRLPEEANDGVRRQFSALKGARQLIGGSCVRQGEDTLKELSESGWVRPQALRILGKLALMRLNITGACQYWQKLYTDFPNTKSARAVAGPMACLYIIQRRPVSKELRCAGALYLAESKEYSKALSLLDPKDENHAYHRLRILNRACRYAEAISCARDFRHNYPHSPYLERVVMSLAYNLGTRNREFEEALACYGYLLEQFPQSSQRPAVMLAMGDCLVGLGQFAKARECYLEAAHLDGHKRIAQIACYSIAGTYLREGDKKQALIWLEKASRCRGEMAEKIWRDLGNLYLELGEPQQAQAAFARTGK